MPTTPAERKALMFLGAVSVLGVGARVVASVRGGDDRVGAMQPALERQLARAEGAARRDKAEREARAAAKARGGSGRRSRGASGKHSARDSSGSNERARPPVTSTTGPIDVDTADTLALATLPGVGPGLARRIVEDRRARGPFGGPEALDGVPGIGPRLLEKLAPRVTFSGPRRPILGTGQAVGAAGRQASPAAGRRKRANR